MQTEILTYRADGLDMRSHLFVPDGASGRPGVLVFPEAFGLGPHAISRAERLAGLGYVALACDLHGQGVVHEELEDAMALLKPLFRDPIRTRARAQGGLQALLGRAEVDPARLGAIGFCFGGTMALELARSGAAVGAVVGFHSGLATALPKDARNIVGKVLVCIGADDPSIDAAARDTFTEEMRAGGADWQMHVFGGVVHSFTNPRADAQGRPEMSRYDERADARSWAAMRGLFGEVFGEG